MLLYTTEPKFTVSLGNCGTSVNTVFSTLDDCIVIRYDNNDRKVSLKFLKNATNDVEVRFFNSINSKKYTEKRSLSSDLTVYRPLDSSLLFITDYLTSRDNVNKLVYPTDELVGRAAVISNKQKLFRWMILLDNSITEFLNSNKKLKRWNEIFKTYTIPSNIRSPPPPPAQSSSSSPLLSSSSPPPPSPPPSSPLLSSSLSSSSSPPPSPPPSSPLLSSSLSSSSSPSSTPLSSLSSSPSSPLLSNSNSSSVENTHTPHTPIASSNSVGEPSYRAGETKDYVTLFHTKRKVFFKKNKNPDGSVSIDFSKVYTSPPVGGSNKRYITSRKYRKYQSRKKSRRHIKRRTKTHKRKSRRSRK